MKELLERFNLFVLVVFLTTAAATAETAQLIVSGQTRAFLLERPVAQGLSD
jgi:hypothetical protein